MCAQRTNKYLCLSLQVHQPFRLKRYRFFDIGNDHYYFDDFQNEEIFQRITRDSYAPAGKLFLDLIKNTEGRFKAAFSISGTALEQIEMYAPELIDSFTALSKTGSVEFLGETYAHSIASLAEDKREFRTQVKQHRDKIANMFGKKPQVFRNSELLYDDYIAAEVYGLGFKGIITEGAKNIMGWKSPNFLYASAGAPNLKLLLRNGHLSEDLTKNFSRYDWSEYPLTADKYARWIASEMQESGEIVCLDLSYDTFGVGQARETGIFDFLKALPEYLEREGIRMILPSEAIELLSAKDTLPVPDTISWSDEDKNTSSWLGNVLQGEAFKKLGEYSERTRLTKDRRLLQDWTYLQSSDHFFYMSTRGGDVWKYRPYDNAYEAFSNYMNVLSDFHLRVEAQYPSSIENEELNALLTTIQNQGDEIQELHAKIDALEAEKEQSSPKRPARSKKATE